MTTEIRFNEHDLSMLVLESPSILVCEHKKARNKPISSKKLRLAKAMSDMDNVRSTWNRFMGDLSPKQTHLQDESLHFVGRSLFLVIASDCRERGNLILCVAQQNEIATPREARGSQ